MGAVGALLAVCMPATNEVGDIQLIAEHVILLPITSRRWGVFYFWYSFLSTYSATWRLRVCKSIRIIDNP